MKLFKWDAASGQEIRRFATPQGYHVLIERACITVGRDLTPEEREQFGLANAPLTCPVTETYPPTLK